jgi:hypothetical protein
MTSNPLYDPNFSIDDFVNEKKEKQKGLERAGQEGMLNPELFTYEQKTANVGNRDNPRAYDHIYKAPEKDYSWDKLTEDDKFIGIMKDFYEKRDNIKFDDDDDKRNRQDIVDYFVSDRTWKQANVVSATKDLLYVNSLTKEQEGQVPKENVEQLQRLYYGINYWNNLPWFKDRSYAEIGGRVLHNMYAGTLDVTNLGSLGIGMFATKTAGKKGIAQTTAFTINQYLKKYAMKTAAPVVAFDAATMAGFDYINQKKNIEMGIQEKYDPIQTGAVTVVGAGVSILPTTVAGYVGTRASLTNNRKIPSNILIQNAEGKVVGETVASGKFKSVLSTYDNWIGGVFDKFQPWKVMQQKITGVKGEVSGLKKAKEGIYLDNKGFTTIINNNVVHGPAVDPVSLAYFQWRLTTASTTRAHHATMEDGVLFLPDPSALKAGYVASGNPGINVILKEFDEVGEAENFLMYVAAKRAYHMHVMNRTGPKGFTPFARDFPQGKDALPKDQKYTNIPFSEEEALAIIHRAEMNKQAYKDKYGLDLDRTLLNKNGEELSFPNALAKLKVHTDDLLKLSEQAGILSPDQVARIKAANPDGFIPFYAVKQTGASYPTSPTNVVSVGSKVKKKTTRGELDVDEEPEMIQINALYDSFLDYTYSVVIAADRNRAKQAQINLLDAGVERGVLKKETNGTYVHVETGLPIMQEISTNTVKYTNILKDDIIKQLQNQGYKITKDDVKDLSEGGSIQGASFVNTLRDGDDLIDIVYVNGKAKFYKVLDPAFVNMYRDPLFKNYLDTAPFLSKAYDGLRLFTKVPAKMITLSPRFAAKNVFRDTFTGVVNSQFGFIPLWSTGMGFLKTFAGTESFTNAQNKTLMKKFTGMFERSMMYNDFLRQGGGFSSRNQTERFFGGPRWEVYLDATGKASKDYKNSINAIKKMLYMPGRSAADGWVEFIGRLEYASRLAEYSYAKKFGLSTQASSFAGREISTDFGMHGSSRLLQEYNQHTMFFNAGLQGFYRMSRELAQRPIKSSAIIGGIFVAPEVAMWTLLNGREEYEELSDEFKMMNYVFPVLKEDEFNEDGQRAIDYFIAWPRPFDYQFAPNIARGILESVKRKNPGTGIQYTLLSFQNIMPGFATPTAISPWASILLNQNWQGDKIVPQHLLGKIPDQQVSKATRLSAIKIAEGIKWMYSPFIGENKESYMPVSPIHIDYIMNTYMAGLGQIPLDLIDARIYENDRYVDGVDVLGPKPAKSDDRVDIVNNPMSFVTSTFKVNTPIRNNERVNKFYELYNKMQQLEATEIRLDNYDQVVRNLKEVLTGDAEHKLENESLERQELRMLAPTFDIVLEGIKQANNEKAVIRLDSGLSAQEKADEIAEIDTAIIEAIRLVIQDVRSMDLETIDSGFFGNEDRSEKVVDIFNTRESLEKGVDFINNTVKQSMELFDRF